MLPSGIDLTSEVQNDIGPNGIQIPNQAVVKDDNVVLDAPEKEPEVMNLKIDKSKLDIKTTISSVNNLDEIRAILDCNVSFTASLIKFLYHLMNFMLSCPFR